MSTMIAEVYDALISAGADEGKARKAAEAMADYDRKFHESDVSMQSLDKKMDIFRSEMNGRIQLVQWMLAVVIAAEVLPLLKHFFE